jgi:hypothetical protein
LETAQFVLNAKPQKPCGKRFQKCDAIARVCPIHQKMAHSHKARHWLDMWLGSKSRPVQGYLA